jgi:hypothetical protein
MERAIAPKPVDVVDTNVRNVTRLVPIDDPVVTDLDKPDAPKKGKPDDAAKVGKSKDASKVNEDDPVDQENIFDEDTQQIKLVVGGK